jgi:hypothetical protein
MNIAFVLKLFLYFFSLPMYFVVPSRLMNNDVLQAAGQYMGERLPVSTGTFG